MNSETSVLLWGSNFVVLNLYANLISKLLEQTSVLPWLAYWAGFFILAFLVARYVLQLKGLTSFGLQRHRGWGKNLAIGFAVGFATFLLKYIAYYSMGMFELAGWMDAAYISQMLATALLAMFFSSAINDVLIRGYWLAFCTRANQMKWYIALVTILYALDDSWNEGIHIYNIIYAAVLGVSFAYTVYKTRSVWMSVGMHWGGNMMFRVMYGFNDQGIWKLENIADGDGMRFYYVGVLISALALPVVYLLLRDKTSVAAEQTPPNAVLPQKLA